MSWSDKYAVGSASHKMATFSLPRLKRYLTRGRLVKRREITIANYWQNVLNMADSFVDNVLHAACRNSKERGSKVLEIRDIQVVLERAYNIRVPGYSSDELRTVRKVVPSAGWIAKMSAVQAAKVMPSKND